MQDKMLITLCYVYMWVRFHKCYSTLIRNSLSKLKNCSLTFSISSTASLTDRPHHSPLPPGETIFLQLGDKAVYVTEPQVGYWNVSLANLA